MTSSTEAGGSVATSARRAAPPPEPASRTARPALIAYVAITVIAFPVLLYFGRDRWFRYDEWDFLASREAVSLYDLFQPHAVHWTTLPILAYRALWTVFGINTYVPYQVLSILGHLAVAALLRAVMRRAGVGPWTATAAATVLVFLGAGEENILWAFQIEFTAALAFGLAHLMLADHDGPVDRRDLFGILCGFLGLLCAGVAVTMVFVVGCAMLLRRGWRVALLHTAPLGAVYLVWYLAIGNSGLENQTAPDPGDAFAFLRTALATAFDGIAQAPGVAWVLAAVLVVGLGLAWRDRVPAERARLAAPVSLLIGAFVFLVITAIGRADAAADLASATRFVHVTVTLVLASVAVAADAFIRRWRVAGVVLGIGFVVAIVGNVREFERIADTQRALYEPYRQGLLLLPTLPLANEVPRDLRPDTGLSPWVTMGWLRDGVDAGRIPEPDPVDPARAAAAELTLVLRRTIGHEPVSCEPLQVPAQLTLQSGTSLKAPGAVVVTYTDAEGTMSGPVPYPALVAQYIVAFAGPLDVRVQSPGGQPIELCDEDGGPLVVPGGPR